MPSEANNQSPAEIAIAQRKARDEQQRQDDAQHMEEARTKYVEYMTSDNAPAPEDGYDAIYAAEDLGYSADDMHAHDEFIKKYRRNQQLVAERQQHAQAASDHRIAYEQLEKRMKAELEALAGLQRRAEGARNRSQAAERELKKMQSMPEAELFFPQDYTPPHKQETFTTPEQAMDSLEQARRNKK